MYGIPVNAEHPEEAWTFDQWMFIDNSAKMGYETLNGPCVIAQLGEFKEGLIAKIGADNRMTPYLDAFPVARGEGRDLLAAAAHGERLPE